MSRLLQRYSGYRWVYGLAMFVALALTASAGLQCAGPQSRERGQLAVAFLPLVNYTEVPEATEVLTPLVIDELERKGMTVVRGEPIEDVLWRNRIRQTDMVGRFLAGRLAEELQVSAVVVGMVTLFRPGKVPEVGMAVRMVSVPEAEILWAHDMSFSGADFTGVLGLGTVRDVQVLSQRLVSSLMVSLRPYRDVQLAPKPQPPAFYSLNAMQPDPPPTYMNTDLDFFGIQSVGVIPFRNESERRGAGEIVTVLFVTRLHNLGKFRVIEPGVLREEFLRFRVRARGEINRLDLRPLNREIGAEGYITGTVEKYEEGLLGRLEEPPEVEISARMLRADDDTIVWSMHNRHKSDDYNLLLDFGRIYSIIPLAQLTVIEMVQTFLGS